MEDGRAYPPGEDHTCGGWTSRDTGKARVGHHDQMGDSTSWNSAHDSNGCSNETTLGQLLFMVPIEPPVA
jgi:hypothetical protein